MHTHADKTPERNSQKVADTSPSNHGNALSHEKLVDNRPETIAQRKLQTQVNNSLQTTPFHFQEKQVASTSEAPVQRTVKDAIKYVTGQQLWRPPGRNLIRLMATLYLEGSPEFDEIYNRLIQNLPEVPVKATDGYDPPTVTDVDMNLEAEIARQRDILRQAPPKVGERVKTWRDDVEKRGIKRRASKSSDGRSKRAKMMNAGGKAFRLYNTKTAPTRNQQAPGDQGKSAFFKQNQSEYFRSSNANVQKDILGIVNDTKNTTANRLGDVNFANSVDNMYTPGNGSDLLKKRATPQNNTPFGLLHYNKFGQGHPGPKLGAEINSFTYNKLDYHSTSSTYAPGGTQKPKKYLEQDYFERLWHYTNRHHHVPEDYGTELFEHYKKIVTGARGLYPNGKCKFENYKLTLVYASMGGKTNFFDYPAVIFEFDDKTGLNSNLQTIKDSIIQAWNSISTVKMTERQSFGFLYPAISDLEKSIRIWPGQYQIEDFLATLAKIITPRASGKKMEMDQEQPKEVEKLPLLSNTLKRSMNLARSAVDRVKQPSPKVKLLFNRIASNYAKGVELLNQWNTWQTDAIFAEATQIIENINEAVLHLSSEYDQGFAKSSFESAVLNHYHKHLTNTDFNIESFYLTHSGQQGSTSAMLFNGADEAFLKKKISERGPIYFETMTSQGQKQPIKLVDPSYNFTCSEEVEDFATLPVKGARIYDITNLDPAKLAEVLQENPNQTVSLYASFSKHFQFGTDSTNLGFVLNLQKKKKGNNDKKHLGSYVPEGAVWNSSVPYKKGKQSHVPAVPSELYHHAALLFDVQTGHKRSDDKEGQSKEKKAPGGPQQFFMGHQFSDWHETALLEVADWVGADNQCGIHTLHHLIGTPDSREELLEVYENDLSFSASITLGLQDEWLSQTHLIEIAGHAGYDVAIYEFNQQYGRWALVDGVPDASKCIGRVPHASGGGNDHWVPLIKRNI